MKFEHKLGLKAKDKITGFQGIIIGRTQWLTGCNTYTLKPRVDKDGKDCESCHFDEDVIEITNKLPLELGKSENVSDNNGGPHDNYPRQTNR